MAKEFPYFKFFPGEWIKGDITLCSLAAQGLFINICAYYWAKDGIMSLTNVEQRFNASAELSELLENGVIYKEANTIQISFLEDQFPDFINKRKQCSNAGKQSGKMRRTNPSKLNTRSTDDERPLNDKIREEKIREEKIREDKKAFSDNGFITKSQFDEFWELYPKKADKGKALSKWNLICNKKPKERPKWRDVKRAVLQQKNTDRWKEGFIPMPTTWLNQSRWMDDPKEMKGHDDRDKLKGPKTGTRQTDFNSPRKNER